MAVKNCFIRGSVVRYVTLPSEHVDTQLLEDATRRGTFRAPDTFSLSCFPRLSQQTRIAADTRLTCRGSYTSQEVMILLIGELQSLVTRFY